MKMQFIPLREEWCSLIRDCHNRYDDYTKSDPINFTPGSQSKIIIFFNLKP